MLIVGIDSRDEAGEIVPVLLGVEDVDASERKEELEGAREAVERFDDPVLVLDPSFRRARNRIQTRQFLAYIPRSR